MQEIAPALKDRLPELRARVDRALAGWLPAPTDGDPGRLAESMRYAVLGEGKRLRPSLLLLSCQACGGDIGEASRALRAACAVELLHAYSLVHDDLPAMDNDDMRRGRPSTHRAFGEATAILCGDALLTLAFEWMADVSADAVRLLARRAGALGMVRGQARDLAGAPSDVEQLETIHAEKTGALFAAAAGIGALCAGADAARVALCERYGSALGIAFQHADDLADADHRGLLAAAHARALELCTQADDIADALGDAGAPLRELAAQVAQAATAQFDRHDPA
jgi:geranylgeranyl pyrophosphate synthase